MMLVESITLREIRMNLREPFEISSGVEEERRILLLELREANGTSAWSECVAGNAPNYFPETVDSTWMVIKNWLAPRVVGHEFESADEVGPVVEQDIRGNNMARAAVEMGFWALQAAMENISLATLLGGTRDKVSVGISIGIQPDVETLISKAERAIGEGYSKIKIKIKPDKDVEYVRAVREALGDDVAIIADANSAYTLDDVSTLRRLDEFNLVTIEQPLAWDDLIQHADLQQRIKTPICLDESITTLTRAREMVKLGSGKIINIKPGRVGGLRQSKFIHDFAEENGVPVWCGGMLESGIGRAHNVALASLPNFSLPSDLSPSHRYWDRDIVRQEWTMDPQGYIQVPHAPGIGVDVDVDFVDDLTVQSEEITS
ncbi:MAG: o-succinylbenzoate synthase [Gemmatimonadetes bacterium]|nr:o-succinylbenzoate synthase [Gemmatimonadota bacterium]